MRKNYPLRIDEAVLDGVRRWADDDLRSLNGQIEYLLRESLRRAGRTVVKDSEKAGTADAAPASDPIE